jgi:hypothetical protein
MSKLTTEQSTQLELLVDAVGLVAVVEGLSLVCFDKQSHLAENWQDSSSDSFNVWKRNGKTLARVASGLWRQQWERA